MAARETMTALLGFVRGLINDPAGATQRFSDEQVQEHLDYYRLYTREQLFSVGEPIVGWQGQARYWESDVALTDNSSVLLSLTSSDTINGFWKLATIPDAVFANGFTYDVYASAAEMLTEWAGLLEQEIIKFSADGSSYEFASRKNEKLELAAQYMARSSRLGGIQTAKLVRNDTATY